MTQSLIFVLEKHFFQKHILSKKMCFYLKQNWIQKIDFWIMFLTSDVKKIWKIILQKLDDFCFIIIYIKNRL